MVCESENITYKEAARDFELKLEQVMTSSSRLNKRSPWFITVHTLSQKLATIRRSLPVLIPYLQILTCRMCWITYHDYYYLNGKYAWDYRWKVISQEGYHVRKNRHIDYGNLEYETMLRFLYLLDEHVRNCLNYLIDYWPSLDVCKEPHLSSTHGVSMKGDIIEIYLAGLRGETVFRDTLQICLDADGLTLPTIYTYLNDLCRLVHYLNACFIDGHMKSSGNHVYRLVSCPEFTSHPFVKYWTNGNKSHCLHALFCADD